MTLKNRMAHLKPALPGLLPLCLFIAGCSHHRIQAPAPPAPPETSEPAPAPAANQPPSRPHGGVLFSQVGTASWYGAPYHNARSANGSIYDQNAMTAANRTLPMGTTVRVTNLATRQSAVVTITDRGPFVPNRMIDLSRAAAIKTGVYRSGVARVRMDVLRTPRSATQAGHWCVQIGAFRHTGSANKLRHQLQRKFPTANVIEFKGSTGHWVRIRPNGESHRAAKVIAASLHLTEAEAYVVRLN
ncbi:MAG: septal ring lytic transglycosylase RlpA family protein [Acidobacteriaceae bacterium]